MTVRTELLGKGKAWFAEWEPIIVDHIQEFAAALLEVLEPAAKEAMARFCVLYEVFQRVQLKIILLRRWHISYNIACWLSRYWPKRWLPELKPELWEWDEEETE